MDHHELDLHDDDVPVGRVLSRREVLTLFGVAGAALLGARAAQPFASAQTTGNNVYLPFVAKPDTTATTTPATSATTSATATATTGTTTSTATTSTTSSGTPSATATRIPTATTTTPTATSIAATSTPSTGIGCVVKPDLTEGPYFVDEMLNRSDIRPDPSNGTVKAGAQLQITFRVYDINSSTCTPLVGAQVDLWQCDALGVYSDVSDPGFNTKGQKFLRGYQTTDSSGLATFTTIYPGWYQGRTVHQHFKIRATTVSGQSYEFTSQLFFDDTLTDTVHAQQPYAAKGQRTLRNSGDGIYRQGGDQLVLAITPTSEGYATTFDIGLYIE